MIQSLYPKEGFLDTIAGNPDLWGPVYIPATLIVVLFMSSSMNQAIKDSSQDKTFAYDFTRLSIAMLVISLYQLLMVAGIWIASRRWKVGLTLVELMNVYGYNWTIWIPIAVKTRIEQWQAKKGIKLSRSS